MMRRLHAFLVHSEGLEAAVTVVSKGDFIDILIPYLSDLELDEYDSDIILAVVRFSNQVDISQIWAAECSDKAKITVARQNCNWNYGDTSSLKKRRPSDFSKRTQACAYCRIVYHLVIPPEDIDHRNPIVY